MPHPSAAPSLHAPPAVRNPLNALAFLAASLAVVAAAWIPATPSLAAAGAPPVGDPRQSFRFEVTSHGPNEIEIRGLYTVDGKDRLVERTKTPFSFRCEAGTAITGYFEVLTPGRSLDLRVIDPAYSKRRAAASRSDVTRVRFAWARPGVGPRCLDPGLAGGACPDSVPGVDAFVLRLDAPKSTAATAAAPADTTIAVPWSDVREAMTRVICVVTQTAPDGKEYRYVAGGEREACGAPAAATATDRAVDATFAAAPILFGALRADVDGALAPGLTATERHARAVGAYLGHEPFLRAFLPRLQAALAAEGARCTDAPAFAPVRPRTVTWDEFAPYVAAYVWPDEVRRAKGAAPGEQGEVRYSFHVCSGLNGIDRLPAPDPVLVRAAFVSVLGNGPFMQAASRHFSATLGAPEFGVLTDDAARTAYLRDHVGPATAADPEVRAAVCTGLLPVAADLGVQLEGCR